MSIAIPHLLEEPLAKHTTYKIGGPAQYLAFPESLAHLQLLADYLKNTKESYAIIGNGSNLLAPDEGFRGWVIKTSSLPSFFIRVGANLVHVSAGANNLRMLRRCADEGLSGLEFLAGIPGTVGGAIWMNAGTASGWIEENLSRVETFSFIGGRRTYRGSELKFSYREQLFLGEDEIILSACFAVGAEAPEKIKQILAEAQKKRKEAQPIEMPSCGSVFRNPPGTSAWACVEKVGLRGHKIGGARISTKHSNFIVNEGGATRRDVLDLISLVKERVKAQLGIDLIEEVVVLKPNRLI